MAIYPFTVVKYYNNPSIWQPNQQVTTQPVPGTSAVSYSITTGTLPLGLSINATTGVISGSVAVDTPQTTVVVGGLQADASTHYCTVIITIESIPVTAPAANQASATGLTDLQATAAQNFINAVNQLVSNNNQLGMFYAWFDVLPHLPIMSLRAYLTSLGYTFTVRAGNGSEYPNSLESFNITPFGSFYPVLDYSPPFGTPQNFPPPPRILITWRSTPVYPQYPYYPWP